MSFILFLEIMKMEEFKMELNNESIKKYNDNRKNFKLDNDQKIKIKNDIDKIKLSPEDLKIIDDTHSNNIIAGYTRRSSNVYISADEFIRFVYIMRFNLKLPTIQMAAYLEVQLDSFGKNLKSLGWNYTAKESQQLAAKKSRNYSSIRAKSKLTRLSSINGSLIEDKVREYINLKLTDLLPECEVIVGCNNLSILYNINKEIDIPVIIFKDNKIKKYAIEFNGYYWHEVLEKDDVEKKQEIIKKGYKYFEIWQCSTDEQREEKGLQSVDEEIEKIIQDIIKDFM